MRKSFKICDRQIIVNYSYCAEIVSINMGNENEAHILVLVFRNLALSKLEYSASCDILKDLYFVI
jgi:hypothetical protein